MQAKVILIWILFVAGIASLFSQETARERIEQRLQNETSRQQGSAVIQSPQGNRSAGSEIDDAKWSRTIYRYLDLTKEDNAPLYHIVTPAEGQSSLFTMLFRLLQNDAIPAFEYLDGQEQFTAEYRIDFKEFLDRFDIYHQADKGTITVNDADIPSNEVLAYFVKEVYYFDSPTSSFKVRPLAICPLLLRRDQLDIETTRYPLFWVPYAELEPYARRMPVMGSSLNNSINGTVDDFFRLRKYDGEIYKVQNPRNLAIAQYTNTPEEMKAEQERIEKELKDFEKGLWTDVDRFIPSEQSTDRRDTKGRITLRNRRSASGSSVSSSVTMRDRRY